MQENIFLKSLISIFSTIYKQLDEKKQFLEKNSSYKSTSISISMMELGGKHVLGIGIISELEKYIEDDLHTFDFTLGVESLTEDKWELNFFIGWASFGEGHIAAHNASFEYDNVIHLIDDLRIKFSEFYEKYNQMCENPISSYGKYT